MALDEKRLMLNSCIQKVDVVVLSKAIVVFGMSLLLSSCVTPVAIGPHHFGIGIYNQELRQINPDVNYEKVAGVGILLADGRFCLGYADCQSVYAHLEGCSYCVQTPLADFAVGKEAENIGIEFLSSK